MPILLGQSPDDARAQRQHIAKLCVGCDAPYRGLNTQHQPGCAQASQVVPRTKRAPLATKAPLSPKLEGRIGA